MYTCYLLSGSLVLHVLLLLLARICLKYTSHMYQYHNNSLRESKVDASAAGDIKELSLGPVRCDRVAKKASGISGRIWADQDNDKTLPALLLAYAQQGVFLFRRRSATAVAECSRPLAPLGCHKPWYRILHCNTAVSHRAHL